ncbi:unnamed protein product, partial [Oikopleura dioica]
GFLSSSRISSTASRIYSRSCPFAFLTPRTRSCKVLSKIRSIPVFIFDPTFFIATSIPSLKSSS